MYKSRRIFFSYRYFETPFQWRNLKMKVLTVVLAVAFLGVNAAPKAGKDVAGDVEKAIKEILEKISEPLVDIHDEKTTINLVVEKLELIADNIVLKGIKNLDIKQLDYDETSGRLDYDFTFGDIAATVDFELDLTGLVELEHHPTIDVDLKDLKLAGYAVVDTDSEPNQLTDFDLLVTLDSAEVDLKNILNDDELTESLNTVLNENLPTMVNSIAKSLQPIVSPIVQSAINIILRHTEPDQ
ncbi:hypothetical protein NQ315_016291 [Exocentrus adspersus]|uniref:Uncharacterized protein n=1 Tax=Exocentrus adspersus TaxID=1586481 RepID=A0AAV8VPZ1_9CUCU|nr:hypothetical protein NQ315_016291 [Exocentrus adspersus]